MPVDDPALATEVRKLRRKLERARANLARLEDQRDRSHAYMQAVISDLQATKQDLTTKNEALEQTTTQLAEERARALSASEAKSRFLANMSHELRTPLNAIIGYAELVLEDEALAGPVCHEVTSIRTAGQHLLGLINDILDIAKIEAGQVSLEQRPLDVQLVLGELVHSMSPLATAAGLQLTTDLTGFETPVLADETRLRQILWNLLGNAIKFTKEGSVTLTGSCHNGVATFRVRDTGIGMSEEQLSRVFHPFVQADSSTTRRFGGTGLGLSICTQLVELWGGRISVESQLGVGTTFTVKLPTPPVDGRDS